MDIQIEVGDKVVHTNPKINQGLQMEVLDLDNEKKQAKCDHLSEGKSSTDWFDLNDLTLQKESDGGFS